MTEITATESRTSPGGRAVAADHRSPLRLLAPVAMMAAIFYFSAQPFDGDPLAWWEVLARKVGHFGGYALLAALWAWALAGAVRRHLIWAAAISLAYAVSDEFHQTFVDGRHGAAHDVGIDALGVLAALVLIRVRYGPGRS